jgi:phage replication O-like protein O
MIVRLDRCIMANPQLEDGYTQIANEILENLMRICLPANQSQVLLCIIRKTYGFKKKVDWIANCQIVEATGLHKSTVSRALRRLEQQGLINRNGKSIGFQKDWEQWRVSRITNNTNLNEVKVSNLANNKKLADRKQKLSIRKPELPDQSIKVSRSLDTQKKKENIQKKLNEKNMDYSHSYIIDKYRHVLQR